MQTHRMRPIPILCINHWLNIKVDANVDADTDTNVKRKQSLKLCLHVMSACAAASTSAWRFVLSKWWCWCTRKEWVETHSLRVRLRHHWPNANLHADVDAHAHANVTCKQALRIHQATASPRSVSRFYYFPNKRISLWTSLYTTSQIPHIMSVLFDWRLEIAATVHSHCPIPIIILFIPMEPTSEAEWESDRSVWTDTFTQMQRVSYLELFWREPRTAVCYLGVDDNPAQSLLAHLSLENFLLQGSLQGESIVRRSEGIKTWLSEFHQIS